MKFDNSETDKNIITGFCSIVGYTVGKVFKLDTGLTVLFGLTAGHLLNQHLDSKQQKRR